MAGHCYGREERHDDDECGHDDQRDHKMIIGTDGKKRAKMG